MSSTIISIKENSEDQKKYVLHSNKLSEILGPIKNKPVCIIPILGSSRNENSSIMNSITSFLSEQEETDWIGKTNQGLPKSFEGLKLEAVLESQTLGLRMSEPLIVKKSNGNEIAVLLMDTQGVFDVNSNQRDCSTIVGISLLMSSCIILNLSNDIKKDILMSLKSLLQISAMVSKVNLGNQQKPFKELFILMSNLKNKEKVEFGFSCGENLMDFLTESEPDVKKLLGESFEDVLCFLMSKIGNEAEKEGYEGSADGFQDKFPVKLFEILKPKTINNIIIKGEDLNDYFKTFVDIFNSNEIPNHKTITKAIAKTGDLVQLNKLKDSNLAQSKAFLKSEPFIAQKLLEKKLNDMSIEAINKFGRLKKSNNKETINELNIILENYLKSNYDQICDENDRNRQNFISNKLDKCCTDFKVSIEKLMGSQFIDSDTLDDNLDENKTKFVNKFQQSFNDEEKELFAKDSLKLNENLEKLEKGFKVENRRRKTEANRLNQEAVGTALEFYKRKMNEVIDKNVYMSMDEFKNTEQDVRTAAKIEFEKNCSSVKSNSKNEKESEFQNKLNELKSEFKNVLKTKLIEKKKKQENYLKVLIDDLIDKYENQMDQYMDEAEDEQALNNKHKQEKDKIIKMLKSQLLDPETIEFYLRILKDKIKKSFKNIKDLTIIRLREQESTIRSFKNEFKVFYRKEMDKYYRNRSYFSKENLTKIHELALEATVSEFQSKRGIIPFNYYSKFVENSVEDIYREIRTENDMNTPTVNAIGIDLGTTNSCAAYYKPGPKNQGTVVAIKDINSNISVIPSFVNYQDDGQIIVGSIAKLKIHERSRNTIYSAKRLIGRLFNDPSVQTDIPNLNYKVVDDGYNHPKIQVEVNNVEKFYYPEQISAEVLKKMKMIAEKYFQSEQSKITKAVITVPAYFGDAQKQATKDAGQLAGFEVLKIINEPTAAALAYKFYRSSESSRKVLIYDFGGGTFDVGVLKIEKGEINVLSIGGNNHLGGDDIDNILVHYCLDEFRIQTGISVPKEGTDNYLARLRNQCEIHKCLLSVENETTIIFDNFYESKDLKVQITRKKFEELTTNLFKETMDLVAKALGDSGLTHEDIEDIILVGGTTRIPRVQEMLSDQFGGRRFNHHVNPDEAVAFGAAIQAAILNGQQAQGLGHLKVRDVAPMSLGVRVKGGLMSTIIERNSKIPNIYERNYTTTSDFQTKVDIFVYEGEEEMADRNKLLGEFNLTGIPAAPIGEQNIIVSFEITDEGILKVKAKISSTGFESEEILIEEHRGRLTTLQLEQLI